MALPGRNLALPRRQAAGPLAALPADAEARHLAPDRRGSTLAWRPEIDGLRAIAVVPVMLFHFGAGPFSGGYVGVDVFFVISGYLVTSLILADLERGAHTPGQFLMRRVRRLLPAFAAMLLVSAACASVLLPPDRLEAFGRALVAASGQAANVLFAREAGYFAAESALRPLVHVWSLSVEAQFYVLVLVLPPLLARLGRPGLLALIAAAFCGSVLLAELVLPARPGMAFYLLPTRAAAFAVGMGLALGLLKGPPAGGRLAGFSALSGLSLIAGAVLLYGPHTPYPGLAAVPPVAGAALVIAFATPSTLAGRLLASPPLVALGLLSFGLYLWHQPVAAFARALAGEPVGTAAIAALFVVTLMLALASERLVERPVRRLKGWTPPRALAAFCGAMALAGAIGAVLVAGDGLAQRKGAVHAELLATAVHSPHRAACHAGPSKPIAPDEACVAPGHKPTVAVFGDSHGVELAHALAGTLEPHGHRVATHTFSACGPRPSADRSDPCALWTAATLNHLAKSPGIETIVVAWRIHWHISGDHRAGRPDGREDAGATPVWTAALSQLQRLREAGKQVVLVLQAPELPQPVDVLAWRTRPGTIAASGVAGAPRSWWDERRGDILRRLGSLPHGVRVVDPTTLFCDRESCLASDKGTALYFDDNHPSLAGAERIAALIAEMLAAEGG